MNVFEQLRRQKKQIKVSMGHGTAPVIFFFLYTDENGAFIEVKDEKGKAISPSYLQYTGEVRTVLKSIEQITGKSDFTIDWENPDNKIYLHEHPYLLLPLIHSKKLVNHKQEPLGMETSVAQLTASVTRSEEKFLQSKIILQHNGEMITDFAFLNETHAWSFSNNLIYEVDDVGPGFAKIPLFDARFPEIDLSKYLSLLYSYVSNVALVFEDYMLTISDDKIAAVPLLAFERIDADNSLYVRVGQTLPGTEVDFLDEYDMQCFAQVNELEKIVYIKNIEQQITEDNIAKVKKLATKHLPREGKKKTVDILQEGDLFILPEEIAAAFIYTDLPQLMASFVIVGAEKLRQYKINTIPPKLNINLKSGIDFLEGDASLSFGDENINLFDAISQYQKNRYIILSNGSHALVNEVYMQKLQRLFRKKNNKVQISFFDLPLVEDMIDETISGKTFAFARDIFDGFNKLKDEKLKLPKVNAKLRPYQEQGYKWLKYLYEKKLGGCLADDMGLGKTLQTITLLQHVYQKEKTPSLIVMPKSLIFNWENELKKFAPNLRYYTFYGNNRDVPEAMACNIILTTYAMMRIGIEQLKEQEFCYVVLDESQNIKNANTQASKAVMLLQCRHRLALSGTPVENNLGELYSLFRFINPAMFGSAENFNTNYLLPVQKNNDAGATNELRRKIFPFILRRLKKDVLKELPDKIEQTLYVEMSEEQTRFYEQRRKYYKDNIEQQIAMKGIQQSQFFVFQALNELRQIACIPESVTNGKIEGPKLELLVEQLMDAVANRHKVLVFANFLDALELIGEKLNEQQVEYVTMTGATKDRQKLVDRFQNDTNCKVFLLTLKTGGTGLNLTAADMVFIFDPWWNKAAENQAIDRAHRIGQDKKVFSYKIITKGTIEEKMLQLQEKKSELFNAIISADGASLKSFSQDDVDFILGK
ncbi:MAG: DEAD/DEAH box helicase [Chitinophagaceae bacterium]